MKVSEIKKAFEARFNKPLPETSFVTGEVASAAIAAAANKCKEFGFSDEYTEKISRVWAIRNIAKSLLTSEELDQAFRAEYPTKAEWTRLFQTAIEFKNMRFVSDDFEFGAML